MAIFKTPDINDLRKYFQRAQKASSERMKKYWTTRLFNIESRMRKVANNRIYKLRASGYDFLVSGQTQNYIAEHGRTGAVGFSRPEREASKIYRNILVELEFLDNETSTLKGAREVMSEVRERYQKRGIEFPSEQQFIEFYQWRKQNPVKEFFRYFPPSPPEIASETGLKAISIFNYGDKERQMLEDYVSEFNRYLATKDEDWIEGIPASVMVERINKLYTSLERRRR